MEGAVLEEDTLLWQLRNSRRRFQSRMQELIEKYNQPFEDAPLVQMATLTYETPQGLRIWGGRLIKKRNKGQIQYFEDSRGKLAGRMDGPVQATAQGHELPQRHTQVLRAGSKSSGVDATIDQEDPVAWILTPAVPQSPLKNELRRKYMTQVDILLQETGCLKCEGNRDGKDTHVTLVTPATPAPGCYCVSGKSTANPAKPASSPREWDALHPCSTDMAIVPRNDSLSLGETSSKSFLSSQSFEDDDMCNLTISDLYEGMLHSMSRLLSTKPSSIISTKTCIVQNWSSRRKYRCKNRLNKTYCKGGRQSQRSPKEKFLPCSEPARERGVLRDWKNLVDVSYHKTGLKSGKSFLEVNKPQIRKLDSSWKELKVMPQKCSSTYLYSSAIHHLDQEERLIKLKWLISPVKMVSRPGGHGVNCYKEIDIKFDKLHQEYCLSPRKQPCLTGLQGSRAVDVYRGGRTSPGGLWGLETHRMSLPFSKAKARRLNEAFENLGKRSLEADGCLSMSDSISPLSKTNPTQSPGHSQQTSDLLIHRSSSGLLRKSLSPSKAISLPRIEPLGYGRNRYDEIKEKFDKLHQEYCQKSPQQMKTPLCVRLSPNKARVEVLYQTEDLVTKLNPDSHFHGFQKLSSSPPWHIRSPLGSPAAGVHPYMCVALTARKDHQLPAKRRRLSDPQVCGHWANSWDSSDEVDEAVPRPGEQLSSA
ncbi:Holliday junction recognition protein [Cynocephalus volans]|uniref:Holliday junction recognition protein n=1 Tax=Cynocephalus volans TaxID=110931 RepID=UPI002FC7E49A